MYTVQETRNGPKAIIDVQYIATICWFRSTEPKLDVQDRIQDMLHEKNPTLSEMIERIKKNVLGDLSVPMPESIYVFATIDIPGKSEARISEDPDYSWYHGE